MSRRAKILKRLKERREKSTEVIEKKTPVDRQELEDIKNPFLNFYHKQYKKLLLIPLIMLILAMIIIGVQFAVTGEFINKAVSLKGGTTITIPTEQLIEIKQLEQTLSKELPSLEISIRKLARAGKQTGIIIDTDIKTTEELKNFLSSLQSNIGDLGDYSTEIMGSSLGASFFKETIIALILSFLFMGFVVFLYFRTIVPSLAVILAAFSDIIVTLAIINLLGIKLSTAGIAAFLMIIGYSVDTDILLTTRMLKRKEGSLNERIMQAMKTGMTMTITTLTVVTLALIFSQSSTIQQIMLILLIGLLVDIINTWIQNVGILRWYLEKHGKTQENIY
ncbi:protein translocase subunit SecF [Candidatus Woesearchaeota archaeon]|nr:protein translocase subunit SecF [Candidatus Woesearchaeota archaeon]